MLLSQDRAVLAAPHRSDRSNSAFISACLRTAATATPCLVVCFLSKPMGAGGCARKLAACSGFQSPRLSAARGQMAALCSCVPYRQAAKLLRAQMQHLTSSKETQSSRPAWP